MKKSTFAASSRMCDARHWDKENLALARTATWSERTAHRLRLTPFEWTVAGVNTESRPQQVALLPSHSRNALLSAALESHVCLAVSVGGAPRLLLNV